MGSPNKYLEDDLAQVKELKVGQGDVYVGFINYIFEGTNSLSLGYQKLSDENFRDKSWSHGSKDDQNAKRYNLRDSTSRLLNPGYVNNDTKKSLIGFMFVEHYGPAYGTPKDIPWALAAFQPRQ